MPRQLILPSDDDIPPNPSDMMAQMLHEEDVSKYTILRTVRCMVNDKVRLNDTDAIGKALRDAAEEMGAYSSFGGHLAMERMKGEFQAWVKDNIPNASRKRFKPLTPEVEAWFTALPTKAKMAGARLGRR